MSKLFLVLPTVLALALLAGCDSPPPGGDIDVDVAGVDLGNMTQPDADAADGTDAAGTDAAADLDSGPDAQPVDVALPDAAADEVASVDAAPDLDVVDVQAVDAPDAVDAADVQAVDAVADVDAAPDAVDVQAVDEVAGVDAAADVAVDAGDAATPIVEKCNGIDDDGDGMTDYLAAQLNEDPNGPEGCQLWYADNDGDGYGKANSSACVCGAIGPFKTQDHSDCNDYIAATHPGKDVTEICDAMDNNCDGVVDPYSSLGCVFAYIDTDKDGFGDPNAKGCVCGLDATYSTFKAGDCAPNDAKIYPSAKEACNGNDDDCDGVTDEANASGCSMFFGDADGDGWGNPKIAACLCGPDVSHPSSMGFDCNDGAVGIFPYATETCDGLDNDCDGYTDEVNAIGCVNYYVDADKDGLGDVTTMAKCLCAPGGIWEVTIPAPCTATDGCVCKNDGLEADTCNGGVDLGYLYDDGIIELNASGTVLAGEGGDWYHIKAVDSPDQDFSCDPFNVRAWLKDNPDGGFALELFKHSCGSTAELCNDVTDTGWTVAFGDKSPYGPQTNKSVDIGCYLLWKDACSPNPEVGGECPCVNNEQIFGFNACTDNSDDFYIHVYRKPGAADFCGTYTLAITNGK
jgi:hypothetical protein